MINNKRESSNDPVLIINRFISSYLLKPVIVYTLYLD